MILGQGYLMLLFILVLILWLQQEHAITIHMINYTFWNFEYVPGPGASVSYELNLICLPILNLDSNLLFITFFVFGLMIWIGTRARDTIVDCKLCFLRCADCVTRGTWFISHIKLIVKLIVT